MSAPARGWVALENVVTREWVALQAMPAMGQTMVEYVRADIHDELMAAAKAMIAVGHSRSVTAEVARDGLRAAIAKAGGAT